MLTVEQVKNHSNVTVHVSDYENYESKARFLYIHNERASSLRIICHLPKIMLDWDENQVEDYVRASIDWDRFAAWINAHDDLTESNLVDKEEWIAYDLQQREKGLIGRNGLLDTVQNEVIDRNKIILI